MKLVMDNAITTIHFTDVERKAIKQPVEEALHQQLGIKKKGYQFSPAYKRRVWDGITDFYDADTQTFPTGLVEEVDYILGELQNTYPFAYEFEDNRPDAFIDPNTLPSEVKLLDNEIGEISLRDYQYKAYSPIFSTRMGLLHVATGGGKCITPNTTLLTSNGHMTLEDLFKESGNPIEDKEDVVEYVGTTSLVNRYGDLEKPSHITFNGKREVNRFTTDKGLEVEVTENHPLLTVDTNGKFIWKESSKLSEGDYLVSRVGDEIFGNDNSLTEEDAYALGCLIADGYLNSDTKLDFSNEEPVLLDYMQEYLSKFGTQAVRREREGTTGVLIHIFAMDSIRKVKNHLGITNAVAKDKRIPDKILRAPKHIQLAFLSGYLECECFIATKDKLSMDVISASRTMIRQIQYMLVNLGVMGRLSQKTDKGYEGNYYGQLAFGKFETYKLLNLLTFITESRNKTKKEFLSNVDPDNIQWSKQTVPNGSELLRLYNRTYVGEDKPKKYARSIGKNTSFARMRRMLEEHPKGRPDVLKTLEDLVDTSIYVQKIEKIEDLGTLPTYDVAMPKTHSFVGNTIINHNTEVGSGIIQTIYEHLEPDETIAFFTMSKDIFNQTHARLEERLGIKVGKYGAGKKDIRQVNVVMAPTVASALKVDPEKGLKLTAKERLAKKMAKEIAPRYLRGTNQRHALMTFLNNFVPNNKADVALLEEIDSIVYTCGSDNEVKMKLNGYVAKYNEIVEKKSAKAVKKKKDVHAFLDSIVAFISDEHQHITADTLYNVLMNCHNAIYRVGLSGSIDETDDFLLRRLKATTGNVIARVTSDELIQRGFLAKPTITMTPIYRVLNQGEDKDITKVADYKMAYDKGIVQNEFRNLLIAKVAEMCYGNGKGVLIIVNRIEQGDALSELLNGLNVSHTFLQGDVEDEVRNKELQAMRDGTLRCMIATSIMDEGVDINGINVLIMAAGGKSLRQTIQRVGRAIRKKKTGENVAEVYDFEDRTNEYLYKHSQERRAIYEQEQFDIKYIE